MSETQAIRRREATCTHSHWSILEAPNGLPMFVVCDDCGTDRDVKVKWDYSDSEYLLSLEKQ